MLGLPPSWVASPWRDKADKVRKVVAAIALDPTISGMGVHVNLAATARHTEAYSSHWNVLHGDNLVAT